jgi:uncharacterized membrane protein YgcG
MLTLKVEVAEARDLTAFATLREGVRTVATGAAVASATPAFAARHANPQCDPLRVCGHPPLGRYRLLHHEPAGPGRSAHYGAHLLLFEPQSGPALDAESFGRLGVLVFGGPAGRRTQGGLRVGNEMLSAIVTRLSKTGGEGMTLEVVPLRPRAWWQFWKAPQPPLQALAADALNSPQPPHDELSLLETMLQKSVRRVRDTAPDRDAFDTDTRRDTSDTSASGENFQGKGGAYGGAGASGTWSEGSARGRGVDDAGRIIGVAAGVGAVAAAAAMAADREAAAGASAESGAGGSSAHTTTSTAY